MDPYFKKPSPGPDGPLGTYDTIQGLQPGQVWLTTINEGQFGRILLANSADQVASKDLTVQSNATGTVPNEPAVFKTKRSGKNDLIIEFYGLSAGATTFGIALIEVREKDTLKVVAVLQVHVNSIGGMRAFFELNSPQLAIHSPNTPVHYKMKFRETVEFSLSPADVIKKVVNRGLINHLVISCHGEADPNKGPFLSLGSGFSGQDVGLFTDLLPIVQQVIWIGACSICGNLDGINFCRAIAKNSVCHVVAPTIQLPPLKMGPNQVEVFTRSMPHYFNEKGIAITQKDFFAKSSALGFQMVKVQP